MRSGSPRTPSGPARSRGGVAAALRTMTRSTGRRARRLAIAAPLNTAGFLGASVTAWISTSPSLLPRTWWMWAANIGLSEVYGYATGSLVGRVVHRTAAAIDRKSVV